MSTAALAAMQAGRAAANERKAREHAAAQAAYLTWVKDESLAHKRLTLAREFAGHDSADAAAAHQRWSTVLRSMPKPPPDHAWVST